MAIETHGPLDQYCDEVRFLLQDFLSFLQEQMANSKDRYFKVETQGHIDEDGEIHLNTNVVLQWKELYKLIDEFLSCDENVRE